MQCNQLRALPLWSRPTFTKAAVRSINSLAEPQHSQHRLFNKTYTLKELVNHIKENVQYESPELVVSSVPGGITFRRSHMHKNFDPSVSAVSPKKTESALSLLFNSEIIKITKYPGRNNSGLILFSKNNGTFNKIRKYLNFSQYKLIRIYTYLVVVLGIPDGEIEKIFKYYKGIENGVPYLNILSFNESIGEKVTKVRYKHKVLQSKNNVSLLKINTSCDKYDCISHYLAFKCLTPVLGDFENLRKVENILFGSHSENDPSLETSYMYNPKISKSLHVKPGEENRIPILSHFYSLLLVQESYHELLVSVPPPKTFIWCCKQLGLNCIKEFIKS